MHLLELDKLEAGIGYRFGDRRLLENALTHTSFANEQKIHTNDDYERLEFLGDAILEMVSSAFLYAKYPGKREGELTQLRASLVCEPSLAECAHKLGIAPYIRLGKGEEACGGRNKDSIISDVMEALIGAIYLDCGDLGPVRDFVMRHILSDIDKRILFYDAKTVLQERAQAAGESLHYEILSESGPEHNKTYAAGVFLGGRLIARGEGRSKKVAEQKAAIEALKEQDDLRNG